MNKNSIVLIILACILGSIYVYWFTNIFRKEYIEIIPQIRPGRGSAIRSSDPSDPAVYPVSFLLRGKWRLTTIKVVEAGDLATNKHPTPVWHMISDSNSIPTKAFFYGERIRGMKPAIPKARPMPLKPELSYVLMLEAGSVKGQTNFQTRELAPTAP